MNQNNKTKSICKMLITRNYKKEPPDYFYDRHKTNPLDELNNICYEILQYFQISPGKELFNIYRRPGVYCYVVRFDSRFVLPKITEPAGENDFILCHTIDTAYPHETKFTMFQVWPADRTVYVAFCRFAPGDRSMQKLLEAFVVQWDPVGATTLLQTLDRPCQCIRLAM